MPEFIDPRFRENKPKTQYSVIENERFGLVFAKTVSIISDTAARVKKKYSSKIYSFKKFSKTIQNSLFVSMVRNPPPSLMHQIQPRPSEYIRILAEAGCIT